MQVLSHHTPRLIRSPARVLKPFFWIPWVVLYSEHSCINNDLSGIRSHSVRVVSKRSQHPVTQDRTICDTCHTVSPMLIFFYLPQLIYAVASWRPCLDVGFGRCRSTSGFKFIYWFWYLVTPFALSWFLPESWVTTLTSSSLGPLTLIHITSRHQRSIAFKDMKAHRLSMDHVRDL